MTGSSGPSLSRSPSARLVAIPPLCAVVAGGTAALILTAYWVPAGLVALSSAALLVTAQARGRQPTQSTRDAHGRRFQFGSRVASAIFDASILLPLAWTERVSTPRISAVALVALAASYLVSYQLARGQALGYAGWESVVYRAATAALLVLAVLARSFNETLLEVSLWVFAGVTTAGAVRRAWDVRAQDRQTLNSERAG